MTALYTIGHGNRSLDELVAILRAAGIHTLVDVRATPQSRRHPHFSAASLRPSLETAGMVYHWAGRHLGGKRQPRVDSPHVALADDGQRGYADHMDGDDFRRAAAQLIRLAAQAPTAILCAERLPATCHRALIADYLTLNGQRVIHLIASGAAHEHAFNPAARRESARLVYDRHTIAALDLN